jgi:hypothetical protein
MAGDEWPPENDGWYVEQENRWSRLVKRFDWRTRALAGLCACLLVVIVSSVLAFSLRTRPDSLSAASGAGAASVSSSSAATGLAPLPASMPGHFAFGVMNAPGDTPLLNGMRTHNDTAWDFRYQYLAGGVNSGGGWATWDPGGSFASRYVNESFAAHMIPVLTYYQLLQSLPSNGADELHRDLSNLRNPATMAAYWADWRLLLRRVAAGRGPVVIHVEPDLWGYLEQAHATTLARAFARRLVALRDRLAPHVLLAWHLSVWGTNEDPTYSKPSLAHIDRLAAE